MVQTNTSEKRQSPRNMTGEEVGVGVGGWGWSTGNLVQSSLGPKLRHGVSRTKLLISSSISSNAIELGCSYLNQHKLFVTERCGREIECEREGEGRRRGKEWGEVYLFTRRKSLWSCTWLHNAKRTAISIKYLNITSLLCLGDVWDD